MQRFWAQWLGLTRALVFDDSSGVALVLWGNFQLLQLIEASAALIYTINFIWKGAYCTKSQEHKPEQRDFLISIQKDGSLDSLCQNGYLKITERLEDYNLL